MTKLLFVYSHHAYTSELALAKHEGVTAERASLYEYEGDPPERLWCVDGGPILEMFTADVIEALAAYITTSEQCSFHDVAVLGFNDEKVPSRIFLSHGNLEFDPEHLIQLAS